MQLPWCGRSFNGPGPVARDCLSTGTASAPWPVVVLDISHQLPAPALMSLHEQMLLSVSNASQLPLLCAVAMDAKVLWADNRVLSDTCGRHE